MAKLTHPPFDEWMLSDEPLANEQAEQLQEHLRNCDQCRQQRLAWSSVQRVILHSGQVAPTPGFGVRWQMRLAARRLEKQRRVAWLFFLVMAGLSVILLAMLGYSVVSALTTPQGLVADVLLQLTRLMAWLDSATWFWLRVFKAMPAFTWVGAIFFVGFISLLCVLWFVLYRTLILRRSVG